jgi:DNA repair protein RecN (Recombination protein N)
MLRELRVKNLALIESAAVPFEGGLNVMTGETGAGKSLVIDALLLLRGGRGQTELIRSGADTATVEAVFDATAAPAVTSVLEEAGIAVADGEVVIRRELSRTGRHRAFVNDAAVTLGLLQRLGDRLVEIHGQHEHQRLLEPAQQLDLLDRFGRTEALRDRLGEVFEKYRAARDAVERLRTADRERAQRLDLLRFQVSELDAARLRPGEEAELRAEQRRLQHAEKLTTMLAEASVLLAEDRDAAAGRLARTIRLLREAARLDTAFEAPADALEVAAVHVDEALLAMRAIRDRLDREPGRLESITERLEVLARLKRKYGDTEEAMLAFRGAAGEEIDRLERHDEIVAAEEARMRDLGAELDAVAGELTAARTAAAARLAPAIEGELRALGIDRARFDVAISRADEIGMHGRDRVEFGFSANAGEELRPLARIASGGELSRTMLALHVVLGGFAPARTIVFDEVDAGIGGRVAGALAARLASVAATRQVLCVTHLPQIAARARRHLAVIKAVRAGRTRATVTPLGDAERVEEIARMLTGRDVTETARRHARELLELRRAPRA